MAGGRTGVAFKGADIGWVEPVEVVVSGVAVAKAAVRKVDWIPGRTDQIAFVVVGIEQAAEAELADVVYADDFSGAGFGFAESRQQQAGEDGDDGDDDEQFD